MTELEKKLDAAQQKLAKWRAVFSGWQLGTRSKDDPECQAVRDHRELSIFLRADVNALTKLLLEKKVCTQEELQQAMLEEVEYLDKVYEEKFPGFKSDKLGIVMDLRTVETTKGWKP